MTTLELVWDRHHTYTLWSWSAGDVHQTARIIRRIKGHVYAIHIGPRGLEPVQLIAMKIARGEELVALEREVDFYSNELRHLQGSVVPRCFGFFKGKAEGIDVACLLMEFCSGPPVREPLEFNREVMVAACKIHELGLVHGDLMDGHHLVRMGNGLRIVDFSTAVRHRCRNGIPALIQRNHSEHPTGCGELVNLEKAYGIFSDGLAMWKAAQSARKFW